MKPLDYGLSTELLDEVAEGNLRLLSSVMLYIARRASSPSNTAIMVSVPASAVYLGLLRINSKTTVCNQRALNFYNGIRVVFPLPKGLANIKSPQRLTRMMQSSLIIENECLCLCLGLSLGLCLCLCLRLRLRLGLGLCLGLCL